MHVQRITTDMINEFNQSTSKRDYKDFYDKYEIPIKNSAEDLKRLYFSDSPKCYFISQHFLHFFKFLRDYPLSDPRKVFYTVENGDPELSEDMKIAIDSRNWNSFYQKYSEMADFMIDQARGQGALNISIEWNYKFYPNFGERDYVKYPHGHPFWSKNSGEMLKNRPGHSPYSSLIRHPRTPSPIRSTESTPQREARDKYKTESHSNVNGMSSYQNQNAPASEILLSATALTRSDNSFSRSTYLPGAANGSYNVEISPTPSRVSTISHGDTGSRREVGHSFGPLHFDYTNSQQQNHVDRNLQSSHFKGSPKSYGAPVANPDNTGILDCCRSSSRTTHELEYNTTSQWNQRTDCATATNFSSLVVTSQPAAISNGHPPTYNPTVPPHRTNGDWSSSKRPDGNQNVDYPSQSQSTRSSISSTMTEEKGSTRAYQETRTGHSLQNREESHFQQQINVLLDKGYQSSQYQGSSPRSNAQLVRQDFNGAQSENYNNGFVQSDPWGRDGHEPRQEPFNKIKDTVAITSSDLSRQQGTFFNSTMKPPVSPKKEDGHQFHSLQPGIDLTKECTHSQMTNRDLKPVAADNFTSSGPYSRTHGDVSLGSEVVVEYQTEIFKTTHSSNQELPPSQEQPCSEIREIASEAERPTSTFGAETGASPQASSHQETYGGYSIQPQSVVPNQTPDNTRSDNEVLLQSKSLEQPSSGNIDSTLRTGWQEATTISGDETTRAHGDTHPELNGGISLYPQAEFRNLSPENAQLPPSESLEQPLPEPVDNSLSSKSWATPEPTTLQQDFSMVNDSADMDTLKQHDDSFEELDGDSVKPGNQTNQELNERSSVEFEVANDRRSSLGSINIEFDPAEESVISHQSCFDLDDLRRPNDTPVESIDGNFDDELFKHQIEMSQVNLEVGRTENLITKELEDMQRQQTICPNNPDLTEEEDDNSDFKRQLEEMMRQQAEELRRIKEERRRKQKMLDDELQQMRKESKERFRMFMTCIILKQRFEQQEDNWKDWIKDCRNNIVALQKYFLIFEETYRRVFPGSKKKQPDSDDFEDFESEKSNFSRYVMNTYNALETDFETLKNIEQHYNDAMFLRVLQKCIADVAQMILEISDTLFSLNSDSFSKLDEQMSKLHIDLIYSTTKLRSICSQAENWKYQNVQFPRIEQNYNIEENC